MTTPWKLTLLGSLYLAQGLPFGFFSQALPVMLRSEGASLPIVGLTGLLGLPWALKALWAPWVDATPAGRLGRRRSWIVPLQLAAVVALLGLAALRPTSASAAVLAIVLTVNLLAATQDIATDGLAVSLLQGRERGLGNGVQVGGYRVGMVLGGGLLLITFERLGWSLTALALAGILAVATLPVLWFDERRWAAGVGTALDPVPTPRSARPWTVLAESVRQPGMGSWLLVLSTFKAGDALGTGMLRPFLVDRGATLADIGVSVGTVGFVAGLVGALLGGQMATSLGRAAALLVTGLLQASGMASYALLAAHVLPQRWVLGVVAWEHLVGGMATAALFTAMMDRCRDERGATDYTVQASWVVVANGLASLGSGLVAEALGWPGHFALAATVCVAATALLAVLLRRGALGAVSGR